MTYATIAPPAAEPLSLAELKAHLRIDGSEDDALLAGLIVAARDYLERVTGLCLISRTMRLYLDRWPDGGVLEIARGPVQSIVAVKVYDAAGVPSAASLAGHLLDGADRPARLWLKQVPQAGTAINGIEVDFIAGFGDAATDVPGTLKRAMLTHTALMYEVRAIVPLEMQPASVPEGYERLIGPHLVRRL